MNCLDLDRDVIMRTILFVFVMSLFSESALAATAQGALGQMIKADMAGDPTIRMSMAAPDASTAEPSSAFFSQLMGFRLGLSPVELATTWHMKPPDQPCVEVCQISVLYHVVATSLCEEGCDKATEAKGFEIVKLKEPVDRLVIYNLIKIGGEWKLKFFPIPYVTPTAMKREYVHELEELNSYPPRDSVTRLRDWYKSQLSVLESDSEW